MRRSSRSSRAFRIRPRANGSARRDSRSFEVLYFGATSWSGDAAKTDWDSKRQITPAIFDRYKFHQRSWDFYQKPLASFAKRIRFCAVRLASSADHLLCAHEQTCLACLVFGGPWVDNSLRRHTHYRVRSFLRTVLVGLLAFGWVSLTFHCQLEAIPGFEFLRCSDDVTTSNESDPCADDGCCSVESAKYQSFRQQKSAPVVFGAILPTDNIGAVEKSLPSEVSLGILTAAPPDLPTSWQFSHRTALPVRAPSLAS